MRRLPRGFFSRAGTLARVGSGFVRAGARRLTGDSEAEEQLGEQLFDELDRVKGVAMKIGQIMSYMDVGLPEATRDRLAKLQHGAVALDPDQVVLQLQEALPEHRLTNIELHPVAAASIGQVHRARLDGQPVAVKLRYPGIDQTLIADLKVLRRIGKLASFGTSVDGVALVSDLQERFLEECDYAREADQQERFAALLQDHPLLTVPKVHRDHSTATVLTSEWADGGRFDVLCGASVEHRRRAAMALTTLPWTTLLTHGVLHADPHPGNTLFGERVTVLDFGCVREFTSETVQGVRALARSTLGNDTAGMLSAAHDLGLTPRPERIDEGDLIAMFRWMFAPYLGVRLTPEWWSEGQRFSHPTNPNLRHLAIPPAWLWLQRTIWGLHAVLVRLDCKAPLGEVLEGALEGS